MISGPAFIDGAMYRYDQIDQTLVNERVAQFRDQTQRFLAGALSEDEFRPLRLRNGLYIQRFAPMLRVSIPYGLLSSRQLHMLSSIARRYDRDYGHFTTRQTFSRNWPESRCMRSRPAATASAISQQIIWPESLRMRSRIRGRTAKSSGSGPHCTLNSVTCRASSRLP